MVQQPSTLSLTMSGVDTIKQRCQTHLAPQAARLGQGQFVSWTGFTDQPPIPDSACVMEWLEWVPQAVSPSPATAGLHCTVLEPQPPLHTLHGCSEVMLNTEAAPQFWDASWSKHCMQHLGPSSMPSMLPMSHCETHRQHWFRGAISNLSVQ